MYTVPPEDLAEANALNSAVTGMMRVVGAILSGFLSALPRP
ncbi:hypothetical protein [Paenibacillus sp. OSY-SE]|nr:hypothetical protein [Paenibacillus sp. OSY-SE]